MTDEEKNAQEQREDVQRQVGERLQAARKARQLSIEDIAKQLNIRIRYLRALESGDWRDMPEEVYTLGFLRQYAAFLQVDVDDAIKKLKSDAFHLPKPFTMPDPAIAPKRQWAVAALVLLAVLLVVLNIDRKPPEKAEPSSATPTQAASSGPKPAVPAPAPSMPRMQQQEKVPEEEAHQSSPAEDSKARTQRQEKVLEEETHQSSPVEDSEAHTQHQEEAQEKVDQNTPSPMQEPVLHRYVFKAVDDAAWLQVFDSHGTLLHEALLKRGEQFSVRHAGDLRITCGNAAALEIRVDGNLLAAAGSLGGKGEVVRNLPVRASNPAGN